MIAFNIIGKGELTDRLNWMFDLYDVNKDNTIDRKEMEKILQVVFLFPH